MNDTAAQKSIFLIKMEEDHRWFLRMSVLFGVVFTICLYENLSGITFPLITAVLLLLSCLFLRRTGIRIRRDSLGYAGGILLLGISTCMTDNMFFHFFNIVGIVLLFMMGMIHQMYEDKEWGFTEYVEKFFVMVGTWVVSIVAPFTQSVNNKEKTEKKSWKIDKNVKAAIAGILAALLFFLIVFPLLFTSDKIFQNMFVKAFQWLDPWMLFREFDLWNLLGILFTFLFGMFGLYSFFAGLFRMNLGEKKESGRGKINYVTGVAFTGVLAAVYLLYAGIQIVYLFLRLDTGLPDGMTYSQYAHEGFWQLLFVSIINFTAVIICIRIFEDKRILKGLLCIVSLCTCVMILSAGYRMALYVSEYQLTFLRVLVLWFLGVLMFIFFGVLYFIFRRNFRLFRYITLIVSVCYIGLSLIHVDQRIAEYNIANTQDMNEGDLNYLIYGLSKDAAPALAQIDLEKAENLWMISYLDDYFNQIRSEHEAMDLRSWNYSRSSAYRAAEQWNAG